MMTLVAGPVPEMRVHAGTAIAAGVAFGLITVFLLRLAIKARRNKSMVGIDALLGQIAVVVKPRWTPLAKCWSTARSGRRTRPPQPRAMPAFGSRPLTGSP